jgi:hypothetical protein
MNVTFWMNAAHKGTQPVTVLAGSYPSAVQTDHTLRLEVKLAGGLPLPVLNDSLLAQVKASAQDGILYHSFDSRTLITLIGNQRLPVTGFDMELKSVKRK